VDAEVRAAIERMHQCRPPGRAGVVQQLVAIAGWSSVPWLHTIDAPTLVLAAEADPLVPLVNSRIFTSCISACHWHFVPDAGHLFLFDQPEDAAGVIHKFLATPG
jgi:pimeloyl-ACP methyl ester carboxylesterase